MFEKSLSDNLKQIFDLKKVSFNAPGESLEQECLFVEVKSAKSRIIEARQKCRVDGNITVFCSADKLPHGYFAKKIEESDPSLTKPFFFGVEQNAGQFQNIVERSFSFTYFFDSQYNPEVGTMNQINLEQVTE